MEPINPSAAGTTTRRRKAAAPKAATSPLFVKLGTMKELIVVRGKKAELFIYKGILSGYRVHELTFKQSCRSLLMWHNETLNVWTHLVGFLLFAGLLLYTAKLAGAARLPQPLVECAHAAERAACLRTLALSSLSHGELARIAASLPASAAALPSRTLAALLGDAAKTVDPKGSGGRGGKDGLERALRHLAAVRLPKLNVTLPRWLGGRGRRGGGRSAAPQARRSLGGRLRDFVLGRAQHVQHVALPQLELLLSATAHSLGHGLNRTLDAAARGAKLGEAYLHEAALDLSAHLPTLLKLSALVASLPDKPELAALQREANHVLAAFSEALHLPSLEALSPPTLERWCGPRAARVSSAPAPHAARPCAHGSAGPRRSPLRSRRSRPHARTRPRGSAPAARRPIYFFIGTAMACLAGSAIYHLFGTANSSWSTVLATLDFVGITALIVGSFVPILFYGFYEQRFFRTLYLSLICGLGGVLLVLALTPLFHLERYRELRTLLFASLGLSGAVPVLHMLFHNEFNELSRFVLLGTCLTGGAYLCGTAFYISRFPEVLAPGRFDLALSSHNIWHVAVVLAACLHYAFVLELWRECSVAFGPITPS